VRTPDSIVFRVALIAGTTMAANRNVVEVAADQGVSRRSAIVPPFSW
jgi:hypothetical protein